jgi:glycosyltransferase involved in cell wall biosynthesis
MRWNRVAERGNIEFEAWFNIVRSAERSWAVNQDEWKFKARYIPKQQFMGQSLYLPLRELKTVKPDLVISLYYEMSFALGSLAALSTTRTAYLVMPTYDAWSERTWWREIAKHLLFRTADGAKVTGDEAAELAARYGLPLERSHKVTQGLDLPHYSRARDIDPQVREEKRAALGLKGCVFLYTGRMWSGKGLNYLFEAYRRVRAENPNVSLLMIGDGVEQDHYKQLAADMPDVIFTGFMQSDVLPEYYALADVFVFPTLGDPYGYVVEESMAAGLPVICSTTAGEIRDRLPEGKAGFVVPTANADALYEKMALLAANPDLRKQLGAYGAKIVGEKDLDAYAEEFEIMVERMVKQPRRHNIAARLMQAVGQSLLTVGAINERDLAPSV